MPTSDAPEPGSRSSEEPGADDGAPTARDRFTGLLAAEGIALAIALVTPITPSKTGSTWSPAELVTPDPNYLQKVLASFITVNLLLLVLAFVVWVAVRLEARRRPGPGGPAGR